MKSKIHRFSVPVNFNLSNENQIAYKQQAFERIYMDNGFIILPESYSDNSAATRLVISCHGAGGTVTTDDSQVEHSVLTQVNDCQNFICTP